MAKAEGKVAKRYARALLDHAQGQDVDTLDAGLTAIAAAWTESQDLRSAIFNPAIPISIRAQILCDVAATVVPGSQALADFLKLLLDNGRINVLPQVSETFHLLALELKKAVSLEFVTATELSEREQSELLEKVRSRMPQGYGRLVTASWNVDPSLIGGLVVRSGDKVLDGSLSGSLERLRKELISAA